MSVASNCSVSMLNPIHAVPGDSVLVGHETLEHFVRIVTLRENARIKRERLPELAPCEIHQNQPSFLKRITRMLRAA